MKKQAFECFAQRPNMLDLSYLLFNFSLTDEQGQMALFIGCNHCSSSIITVLLKLFS
jgi:hypothetical protein